MNLDYIQQEISNIREKGLLRRLREIEGEQGGRVKMGGQDVILLCSNNYLGLASHPALKQAMIQATEEYGSGSGASRLISGNTSLHLCLEEEVAQFKGAQGALLFGSGYLANIGIPASLIRKDGIIFSDALNHASIIDGCRITGATVRVYPHSDIDTLASWLKECQDIRQKLVVTDSVFSMDGDLADLPSLVELCHRYNSFLVVDEAHAIGVLGKGGKGALDYFGIPVDGIISMGTFGKALGGYGAFVCSCNEVITFLLNRARSQIFSTALPAPVIAGNLAALHLLETEPDRVELLQKKSAFLRQGLADLGFQIPEGNTPIIPLVIGDPRITMEVAEYLLRDGIYAQGIRPPTVPEGTSRLRITVSAVHEWEDLSYCLDSFKKAGEAFNLI